jgi:cell division protein FtsB
MEEYMNKQLLVLTAAIMIALFTGFTPMYMAYSSQSDEIAILEANGSELVRTNAAMIEEIGLLRKTIATKDCN